MTFAVPVLGGLLAAAAGFLLFRKDASFLPPVLATALMTVPLILLAGAQNVRGPAYGPSLAFNDWVSVSLFQSGLNRLAETWRDLIHGQGLGPVSILAGLAALFVFFLGGFGASLLGLPDLMRRTFRFRRDDATTVFLGAVFLSGIVLFFWSSPRLGATPRPWIVVDIFKLSASVLLAAAAAWAVRAAGQARRGLRFALPAALLLLSLPNTAQFAAVKALHTQPTIFPADFTAACAYLQENAGPEAVLLYGESVMYVPYFTDHRAVLDDTPHAYLPYHLEADQLAERRDDIRRFLDDPAQNGSILAKYGATHVLVKRRNDAAIWKDSLPARIEAPPFVLELGFRSFRYAVFRVARLRP